MGGSRTSVTRLLIVLWTLVVLAFLYLPMVSVVLASFTKKRYFSFPITAWDTRWYEKVMESLSVRDLIATSLSVAVTVTVFSVLLGFCSALAFARYEWKGRKLFQ